MQEPHHSDVIEDNIETHPVKLAVGIVIGAIALVVGILMLAEFAVVAWGSRSLKSEGSMSLINRPIAALKNGVAMTRTPAKFSDTDSPRVNGPLIRL